MHSKRTPDHRGTDLLPGKPLGPLLYQCLQGICIPDKNIQCWKQPTSSPQTLSSSVDLGPIPHHIHQILFSFKTTCQSISHQEKKSIKLISSYPPANSHICQVGELPGKSGREKQNPGFPTHLTLGCFTLLTVAPSYPARIRMIALFQNRRQYKHNHLFCGQLQ